MDGHTLERCVSYLKFAKPANILRYNTETGAVVETLQPAQVQERLAAEVSAVHGSTSFVNSLGKTIQTRQTFYSNLFVIPGIGYNSRSAIQMERAVFTDLLNHMQIPQTFVKSMTEYSGHYSTFINHEERDGQVLPESIWFMISTPPTTWGAFSCCLRIHLDDSRVSGILLYRDEDEPRDIPHLLRSRQGALSISPVLFLVSMFEALGVDRRIDEARLAAAIQTAEQSTGFWEEMSSTIAASQYEQLNKQLHSCRIWLSMLQRRANFQQELGQFLHDCVDLVGQLRAERGMGPEPTWRRSTALQGVKYQMTTSRRLQTELELLHERIQVQVDVMRGFIAQRDAQANISLATTAQQDSGAVRTIAVVTLFFLPATLISAISVRA
ncbi:hypothetical protein LTR47_011833 [Exophiala xenobiotica]|nr:hypothetical protein LTR92_010712 [Exophiala xenobiotica]KAK5203258.1 hypothetical protein LTR41_010982 [Exophiala xenobiotica]KAK5217621.1 hypothetical protein LTR47_011833 [Exophiala xenobiotica]KAK5243120.1 hypothetical protein LTS06_011037 [Exophiala xenobiotica]KAK5281414.1 hypothetical protein LTR40_004894 [Exophiala xenobiotica]